MFKTLMLSTTQDALNNLVGEPVDTAMVGENMMETFKSSTGFFDQAVVGISLFAIGFFLFMVIVSSLVGARKMRGWAAGGIGLSAIVLVFMLFKTQFMSIIVQTVSGWFGG